MSSEMSTALSNKGKIMKRTYGSSYIYKDVNSKLCCVKSCPNHKKISNLVLYPMPVNIKIKEMWCKAFNIPKDIADNPNARVCSLHFKSRSASQPDLPPSTKSAAPPSQIITVYVNNNNYKVMESSSALPSLNPPIPPDISQELSARPNNLEKVEFLKQAISKIENLETEKEDKPNPDSENSENVDSENSEQMVLEPDFSEIIELDSNEPAGPVSEQEDTMNLEPEVILNSSDDCLEGKEEDSLDVSLELDCEEEQLSEIQLDVYMKEMVEFLSANQTVYRLAQTSHAPKFPTGKSGEVDAKTNAAVESNASAASDGGSALAPTTKLFQNSILVSPVSNVDPSNANSSPFIPVLPPNSSITDVTKKFSIVQDASGKILTQNISSNLSVNGNVIFSKNLNINQNPSYPIVGGSVIPVGSNPILSNTNLPFIPNINMANFDWNANPKQASQTPVGVLKNNSGSTGIPQKLHILTPVSSVSQMKPINSQPLSVISSQGNIPFILSPFVPASKSVPSNVVFSFAPLTNASELKTVFTSAPMPPSSSGANTGIVSSQPGFSAPPSTVYKLVNLPEAAKPVTLTNKLEQVVFKAVDSAYKGVKSKDVDEQPSLGENTLSPTSKSDTLSVNAGPSIQIVDVKGAKEGGAGEFFGESKSSTPLDNDKKIIADDGFPLDEDTCSGSEIVDAKKTTNSNYYEYDGNTINYKSSTEEIVVCQMDSIFAIQEKIPLIGTGVVSHAVKNLFNVPRGEVRNRLTDSDELRKKLRNAGFVTASIPWMLKKKYLPEVPPCSKCGDSILMLEKNNNPFMPGYCYTCYNSSCHNKVSVKRCTFWDRYKKYSTECLLLLTYHWACMSPLQEILLDIDMDLEDIWHYFKGLQLLCGFDVQKNIKLGSAYGNYVEASVVKLGRFFILGAYDRKSKMVRMDVLSPEDASESMTTVKLLLDWLNPDAFLVCQKAVRGIQKGFLRSIKTIVADSSVTDIKSTLPHTLNIELFLKKNIKAMFGDYYVHAKSKDFLSRFLAERQWREKFYKFGVEGAFWGIMEVIKENNPSLGAKSATIGLPYLRNNVKPIDENNQCQLRWGGSFSEKCKQVFDTSPSEDFPSWKENDVQSIQTYGKTKGPFTSKSKGSAEQSEKEEVASPQKDRNSILDCELITPGKCYLVSQLRDIPEIPGSTPSVVTLLDLLSIKVQHLKRPKDVMNYRKNAIALGTVLRDEGFHSHPVKWLVKKNFINHQSKCYVCGEKAFLRDNVKFSDGCSWSCQNKECKFENIFRRPKFFTRFPNQSMNHLLALIFHWVAQTKIDNILSDTSVDLIKINNTWKAFQTLCTQTLQREKRKLGGSYQLVELAVVQHGSNYVLGVFDRKSSLTVMQTYHKDELTDEAMFDFIKSWLRPRTRIIVNASPKFRVPYHYYLRIANPTIYERYDEEPHVLNATHYMLNHLTTLFGKFKASSVSPSLTQLYLDELMWRERFDIHPVNSFSKLMQEIFYDDVTVENVGTPIRAMLEETVFKVDKVKETIEDKEEETFDNKEIEKTSSDSIQLKEAKIVLKRVPQTVLKYYNCLESDSSSSSETRPVRSTRTQVQTTTSELSELESDIIDIEPDKEPDFNLDTNSISDVPLTQAVFSEEVIATPSDPVFNLKKQVYPEENNSDDDYVADDSDDSDEEEEEEVEISSEDELKPKCHSRKHKLKLFIKNKKQEKLARKMRLQENAKIKKSKSYLDSFDNFQFSDSDETSKNSSSTISSQSVQPLVINVCRKNNEPKFFIKSDSSVTLSAAEDSNGGFDYLSDSRPSSEITMTEASPVNSYAQTIIKIEQSSDIEDVTEQRIVETIPRTYGKKRKPGSKTHRPLEESGKVELCSNIELVEEETKMSVEKESEIEDVIEKRFVETKLRTYGKKKKSGPKLNRPPEESADVEQCSIEPVIETEMRVETKPPNSRKGRKSELQRLIEDSADVEGCIDVEGSSNSEPILETRMGFEFKPQTSEKEKKSNSKLKRPLDESLECVECGETVSQAMDHFMKKFECGDCKNTVYTTCCSSAFFEHRGSLLFGKRMPKKMKRNFGLHQNIPLQKTWYCKCGFNSTLGNKLASHLLKCQKSSGCVTSR